MCGELKGDEFCYCDSGFEALLRKNLKTLINILSPQCDIYIFFKFLINVLRKLKNLE